LLAACYIFPRKDDSSSTAYKASELFINIALRTSNAVLQITISTITNEFNKCSAE
jgi:hypothetical protein